jgi:hypothetical protein
MIRFNIFFYTAMFLGFSALVLLFIAMLSTHGTSFELRCAIGLCSFVSMVTSVFLAAVSQTFTANKDNDEAETTGQ